MADHNHGPGSFWTQYIFSTDHKVIGIQYLVTAMFVAVIPGTEPGIPDAGSG